ncbi:predicted protein [Nematostella vectensis]|uniref:Phorbol-ester/DAG-type domain-containing protein n=1 Tax=Nematostella vectensis TaxID=45351 RepID=A7SVG6_NEMVE|nr:predicted protein [Nematostella vectensis]|eukprot:XP_001624388.1 predicted protein [Nematostella vectensis]
MAHPRKFVEKIAIHTQRQQEETRAFEEIMKEVATIGNSMKGPQQQYRSLPNVNLNIGQNHLDLQKALNSLGEMQRHEMGDRSPMRERRFTGNRPMPFPRRNIGGVDTSPYHVAPPYLSPPQLEPGQGWRRAVSDSSLHQTVIGGHHQPKEIDINKMTHEPKRSHSPHARPKSVEVPSIGNIEIFRVLHCEHADSRAVLSVTVVCIHSEIDWVEISALCLFKNVYSKVQMYQADPGSPLGTLQQTVGSTGSLPDLTNLHIPSPLQTPIDTEDSHIQASSPPLYPTTQRQGNMRRHSPTMDKHPFPPQMQHPNLSPLEMRLQQVQLYQNSPNNDFNMYGQVTTSSPQNQSPTASTSMSPLFKNFPAAPMSPLEMNMKQMYIPNNSPVQHQHHDQYGMRLPGASIGASPRMQQQAMSSSQSPGPYGFPGFLQYYMQSNRVPDLIVTDANDESQKLDFARDLSSAMQGMGGDMYNNDDLRVELDPLDMESLQMLSGHGDAEVADQVLWFSIIRICNMLEFFTRKYSKSMRTAKRRADALRDTVMATCFAKSILCRRSCDACRRVIRFWGVRCKDCNLKCHRKCYAASFSPCSTTRRPRRSTCQVRLWRRSHFGKDVKRPSDTGRGLAQMRENQNILPRKYTDAKGRIRQKLINGLYDSFCYSPRQALDLYPSVNTHATTKATVHRQQADSPLACSPARYTRDGDLMHDSPRRFTSPAHEQYLPCPHAWTRTYSCSSRTSNITSFTGSSGYSSMPASCPSSANSHRSCSPTPDFSNIRSLTATLERYNVEEELELVEDEEYTSTGDWRKAFSTYSLPATWPLTRKNTSIKENTRRIVSGQIWSIPWFDQYFTREI